jgi:peptidyl-tRNA hydrolase
VRLKIGILPTTPTGKLKKPSGDGKVVDFILGQFQTSEMPAIKKIMKEIPDIISTIISEGHLEAMNMFNSNNSKT